MSISDDRQKNREKFPGDGNGDERQGPVVLEGIKNEALAQGATDRKHGDVLDNRWVGLAEGHSLTQLWVEGVQQPDGHVNGHDEVHKAHHLLSCHLVGMENLVLGRVCDAVEGQVDGDQEESVQGRGRSALLAFVVVERCKEHESRNADSDQGYTNILVSRELATVEQDVHQHDRH